MIDNGDSANILQVKRLFEQLFGDYSRAVLEVSPASLILLGDHTHYNEGILISVCVDKFWTFLIRKRKDKEIHISSCGSNEIINFSLSNIDGDKKESSKLLKGLVRILSAEGLLQFGFDCVVSSTVPECLGLGSLAAEQVGFMNALRKLYSLKINDEHLLEVVRKNELNIIGKISNIAHHYTVQYCKEKKFFAIDLRTKVHRTISLQDWNYSIVICDSGEKIVEPQKICNERIEECEIGVKGLRLYVWGIKNLRDVQMEFLMSHVHMLPKRIYNRVLYNVKERIRSEAALKFLKKKVYDDFGKLISQSHLNLYEDYDLNNEYSNFLAKESCTIDGVISSKMICCSPVSSTFNIVEDSKVDQFITKIGNSFEKKFNQSLTTHIVKLPGGVKHISLKEAEYSL